MTAKKFSLVELLITLSIILVLSAMLMPMLNRARETAKSTSCKGNMKQSLTALVIYLDTYEVVSTQRWTDTLIATGLVSYPQISALRCPSWIRERDTHKNVFGMRRIIGDAHTLHITGSPSDYVLLADSLNLDTLQQFINFYGNWGPYKLVVHYRHNRKANAGFLDGSVPGSYQQRVSEICALERHLSAFSCKASSLLPLQ